MNKFYVTTAIDYVNAAPHIGHAYEKIAADILARYYRLQGAAVFFLTGVDEHGSKVEKAAAAAGKVPQEFCDEIAARFQQAWQALQISNDYFIRTTEERHAQVVQEIFRKLRAQGDVYKGEYVGLYCEGCEDFLRERDLSEDGLCPTHRRAPKELKEENYFFRLTKYKQAIRDWLHTSAQAVKPDGRRREVLNQLEDDDFKDFSITRSRGSLTWGIPVPDEEDQVIYVWIDALTNYITGAGYLTDEEHWKKFWPADLHLIGKDITKFHCIYWPAILLALDISLPKLVFGHGFITVEGQKMSKSLGNVIDPNFLVKEYGADAVRYFLFAANSFDQDGDFSRADCIATVNSHLANNLGNLLNRVLSLLDRNNDSLVPAAALEESLAKRAVEHVQTYHQCMRSLEFAKAIEAAFHLVNDANKYLNEQKPWSLFKEGKKQEGLQVLYGALELVRQVALLLYPVTPGLSAAIWEQIGFDSLIPQISVAHEDCCNPVPGGLKIKNKGPVFVRIEELQPVIST